MTFLKKLGIVLAKGLQIAVGFGPMAGAIFPTAAPAIARVQSELETLGVIIGNIEAVGVALGLNGSQKLTAAAPLIAQAILGSSLLAGHKIQDEALFQRGAQKIADGLADVLNSVHENGLQTVDKAA